MQRRRSAVKSLAIAMSFAAACGGVGTQPGSGGIEHPTGADEPILVVQDTGGFVMPQYAITRPPTFVLYGDGTLITLGAQIEIYPQPLLPPLFSVRLDEDRIQRILQAARDAGLFSDRTLDDFCGVADVATTVVTVQAQGATYRTSVYGLGFEGCQDDPQARTDILGFLSQLTALAMEGTDPGAGAPFSGAGWVLGIADYFPQPDLPQQPVAWPAGAPSPTSARDGCLVVTGDGASALAPLFEAANQLTPWVADGREWSVLARPLFPGETDPCSLAPGLP